MKSLLPLVPCALLLPSVAGGASLSLIETASQIWPSDEHNETAVFTFTFRLVAGTDYLYLNRLVGIEGQSVPNDPALVVDFTGIPVERLDIFYHVSFEDVLGLGPLNYLAAGEETEMYLTLSVSSLLPEREDLGVSITQFGYRSGEPAVPSQPIVPGPYMTQDLIDVSADPLSIQGIPEPSMALLALVGLVGLARRQR